MDTTSAKIHEFCQQEHGDASLIAQRARAKARNQRLEHVQRLTERMEDVEAGIIGVERRCELLEARNNDNTTTVVG